MCVKLFSNLIQSAQAMNETEFVVTSLKVLFSVVFLF